MHPLSGGYSWFLRMSELLKAPYGRSHFLAFQIGITALGSCDIKHLPLIVYSLVCFLIKTLVIRLFSHSKFWVREKNSSENWHFLRELPERLKNDNTSETCVWVAGWGCWGGEGWAVAELQNSNPFHSIKVAVGLPVSQSDCEAKRKKMEMSNLEY